jgi:hypothetical protein
MWKSFLTVVNMYRQYRFVHTCGHTGAGPLICTAAAGYQQPPTTLGAVFDAIQYVSFSHSITTYYFYGSSGAEEPYQKPSKGGQTAHGFWNGSQASELP